MPKIAEVLFELNNANPQNWIREFMFEDKYVLDSRVYSVSDGYAPVSGAFNPNFSDSNNYPVLLDNRGANVGANVSVDSKYSRQLILDERKLIYTLPYSAKLGWSRKSKVLKIGENKYITTWRLWGNNWFYLSFSFDGKKMKFSPVLGAKWASTDGYYQYSLFFKDNSGNWHSIAPRESYYSSYKTSDFYYDVLSLVNGELIANSNNAFYRGSPYRISPIPIYIGENDTYAYFYISTISQPDRTILRINKNTGEKVVISLLARSDSYPSIASYISKPKDNGDGTFSWYKVITDISQDSKPLVIKRYTMNLTDETITIEDCTFGDVTIDYSNNGYSTPTQCFNLEEVVINNSRYLYLFVYNMFCPTTGDYDKYKSSYYLKDSAVKIYMWKIGDNPTQLEFVGTKNFPTTDIHYIDFIDRDRPELGMIAVSNSEIYNISLTGEPDFYTVNWSYPIVLETPLASHFGEYRKPVKIDFDDYGNIIISCGLSKRAVFLIGDKILEKINLSFEKDDYSNDQLPINTYVTVNPVNFKGDTVPTRVGLMIRSDNAYWTDNNSKYIEVDVTAPTNVNLTITDRGRVYVEAKAIKGL